VERLQTPQGFMKTSGKIASGKRSFRIGMIVPSSNVTMEKEIPQMLQSLDGENASQFTFHSSRVRLQKVSPEELKKMNANAANAALELTDASVDVILYACLVAVMVEGKGAHIESEERIRNTLAKEDKSIPIVTSAGALVATLHDIKASKIAVIAPYLPALTQTVCGYLQAENIEVVSSCSLSVDDNLEVGKLDQGQLVEIAQTLPKDVDAVVLSACVQMPSLDVIEEVEKLLRKPVISAATATVYQMMKKLDIHPDILGYGDLLAGKLTQKVDSV